MVLFSFITPQFESGAQSEVTMLWPDSISSCLTVLWNSGDTPWLGRVLPDSLVEIGTHAGDTR